MTTRFLATLTAAMVRMVGMMMLPTGLIGLVAPASGEEPSPAREEGGVLRAGVASVDITPEKPVTLSGYESRKDLSKGVHDPLSARAVAFERGGRRLVLLSVDVIGFYGDTCERIRKAILEACRLEPSDLFLAGIHTHSAPRLGFDESGAHPNNVEYTKALETKLAGVVRSAMERMAPIRYGKGSGSSPVGANRREVVKDGAGKTRIVLGRNPALLTDREVQVLKIVRAGEGGGGGGRDAGNDGSLAAVLFAYSTHSTSMGPGNLLVSGDVHGLAEQFIEKHLGGGAIAPAFAGASGNIDPWFRVLPEFKTADGWIPEPVLLGTLLGEEVVRVLNGIKETRDDGQIRTAFRTLELPAKAAGEKTGPGTVGGQTGAAPAASAPTVSTPTANSRPTVPLNVTIARLGDVAFVGLGCEAFHEIGRAIKSSSPFPVTFVITHCNGAAGYLPTEGAYPEGGYEVDSTRFAPSAADILVKEVARMLREL